MSRIIKFRVWDISFKRMLILHEAVFVDGVMTGAKGVNGFDSPVEVMQFTGMVDKNGKEIYEGDLIAHPMGIGEVCFSQGRFFVTGFYYPSYYDPIDAYGEGLDVLEVVGNIWQNPELLERKTNEYL